MLLALAFVPSPPLLLTALGGGPAWLTDACAQAVAALDAVDRIVVVGAAPTDGWVTGSIDPTPYGAPGPTPVEPLPLSLSVGATLLGDRVHACYGVASGRLPELTGRVGVLAVGDGSARRTDKGPGHLDPRAEVYDAGIERALQDGDPSLLGRLDADLGAALMVGGLPVWRAVAAAAQAEIAVGGAAPAGWASTLHLATAPFGVGYFAATWTPRPDNR